MIEVFKTTVSTQKMAAEVVAAIHQRFPGLEANFDLDDCDRILRVKSEGELIQASLIIELIGRLGRLAEVLPD